MSPLLSALGTENGRRRQLPLPDVPYPGRR